MASVINVQRTQAGSVRCRERAPFSACMTLAPALLQRRITVGQLHHRTRTIPLKGQQSEIAAIAAILVTTIGVITMVPNDAYVS